MQGKGHLRDRASHTEIALLEHLLWLTSARVSMRGVSEVNGVDERSRALMIVAQEACEASQSLRRAALATKQRTRRVRKRLYRARLIRGALSR